MNRSLSHPYQGDDAGRGDVVERATVQWSIDVIGTWEEGTRGPVLFPGALSRNPVVGNWCKRRVRFRGAWPLRVRCVTDCIRLCGHGPRYLPTHDAFGAPAHAVSHWVVELRYSRTGRF